MFEWQDKNAGGEDRRGVFVTLDGKYIRKANDQDNYILGVVSATPSVVGNAAGCNWRGMFERDKWGGLIYEWVEERSSEIGHQKSGEENPLPTTDDRPPTTVLRPKLNPAYDAGQRYVPRTDRAEWAAVGLVGQLLVRDDGSCQVNGFCRPNARGIATASERGYRVLERRGADQALILLDGTKSLKL